MAQTKAEGTWNSGICGCCQDMSSCCYAYWCCPCFACSTAEEFGENPCLPLVDICGPAVLGFCGVTLCVPPASLAIRVAVRNKYKIKGNICNDIMVTCCCIMCSWCQMHREIKARKQTKTTPLVATQPMVQTSTQVITSQQTVGMMAPGQVQMMSAQTVIR